MDATIIAALVLFLAFIIFDARRRTAQQLRLIAEEKSGIAVASGMTASIGVFYPDVRTTVVMGASEDTGICYYRVLRDGKVINRSKISLGNIDRVDLLVNGTAYRLQVDSCQATSFLKATDVAGRCMSLFSPAQLQAVQRAGLRLVFRDEGGAQKALETAEGRARVNASKRAQKLEKQLAELNKYEEIVHHYADMRLPLDLDDGVKVNYGKLADMLTKIK